MKIKGDEIFDRVLSGEFFERGFLFSILNEK